jgi:hypothetical protein
MAVKFWQLSNATKIDFEPQKWNILRRTAGYTLLDNKRNEAILEELHVTPLDEKLSTYRHNWFQHIHRMEDNRLPKQFWIIIQKKDGDRDDHLRDS